MATGKSLVTSGQHELPLFVEKEIEVDGVGMGVLSDGTPYLTQRGLARMCGVNQNAIFEMTTGWKDNRPREAKIKEALIAQGLEFAAPFLPITKDGKAHYAYPDTVCMAVLEYYAFEAGPNVRDHALANYRRLARASFREFIYTQVGYDPRRAIPEIWRQFHDRVSLVYDKVPAGYFSIFKEGADIIVTLIRAGAVVGDKFIPDGSIGSHWATHWKREDLAKRHGESRIYDHYYPTYFPQAQSNPQPARCYPDAALAEFRRWMRDVYLPDKLPEYLQSKVKQGALPASFSELALAALEDKRDEAGG
jgi:hypothetical protein